MEISKIVDAFLSKYPLKNKNKATTIEGVAVNCVSLSEAWKERSGNPEGSLTISSYDAEDLLIDSTHGNSWETIPVELMNICINRSDEVKTVRVFSYCNESGKVKSNMIGCLDVF